MVNNNLIVKNGANIIINRTHTTTPNYTIPDIFTVSINTPDANFTDTDLTTKIPISGTETIDDCNATTGWSVSGGNVTTNTVTYKPDNGSAASLNLTKSTTLQAFVYAEKNTTSVDGTNKDHLIWIYVKDTTAYNKLNTTTAVEVRIGSETLNYIYKTYAASSITTGWNYLLNSITTDFTGTVGTPTLTTLDYTMVKVNTTNNTSTFTNDDIVIDAIRLASTTDYYKTVDSTTTDETDASATIISKLSVTEANGFLLDGQALFNQDTTKKMFTKNKTSQNSKGNTDLFKFTQKIRYRNINQ